MRFDRFLTPRGRFTLRIAIVIGMVVLLAVQLAWWLIFFQINQEAATVMEQRVELLEESIANHESVPYDLLAGMVKRDGRFLVDPHRREARTERHRRQLAMLLAETLFVLCVVGYGSYRVLRSLQSEIALVRERNLFLDSVSHELKTPIAGVKLALQTLLRRELPSEQRQEVLHAALRDADRLEEQVSALLTAAGLRTDRGESPSLGGPCDLAAVTQEVVAEFSREGAGEGAGQGASRRPSVECWLGEQTAMVPLRADLAGTLVANLLRNAGTYASESEVIELSLLVEGNETVLRVMDRGPGIPAAERTRVFEPLYRVGGTGPHRGTGMGLYIVHELSRSAGGSARALEREGGGTVIEVRLPFVRSKEAG